MLREQQLGPVGEKQAEQMGDQHSTQCRMAIDNWPQKRKTQDVAWLETLPAF